MKLEWSDKNNNVVLGYTALVSPDSNCVAIGAIRTVRDELKKLLIEESK